MVKANPGTDADFAALREWDMRYTLSVHPRPRWRSSGLQDMT
jgi:hypothetical protein